MDYPELKNSGLHYKILKTDGDKVEFQIIETGAIGSASKSELEAITKGPLPESLIAYEEAPDNIAVLDSMRAALKQRRYLGFNFPASTYFPANSTYFSPTSEELYKKVGKSFIVSLDTQKNGWWYVYLVNFNSGMFILTKQGNTLGGFLETLDIELN